MWYVICVLIGLVLGIGGFMGYDYTRPPKNVTNITDIKNDTRVETKSIQNVNQGQATVVINDGKTNYKSWVLTIDANTNLNFSISTNTTRKTNRTK